MNLDTFTTSLEMSPLRRHLLRLVRSQLGGRRGLILLAALALLGGVALNWSWLVAAGIAPLLLGVLPCVAMCALGLCMRGSGAASCSTTASETPRPLSVDDGGARLPGGSPSPQLDLSTITTADAPVDGSALSQGYLQQSEERSQFHA